MITKLEIKGFKSLVDVSIELGAVNVFIGANGSGKSNLLEAVGVLSAIVQGRLEAEPLRYRGVRLGSPSSYRSSFHGIATDAIRMSISDDQSAYSADFGTDPEHSSKWSINSEMIGFSGNQIFNRESEFFLIEQNASRFRVELDKEAQAKSLARDAVNLYGLFIKNASDSFNPLIIHPDAKFRKISDTIHSFLAFMETYAIFTPASTQLRGSRTDIQREPLGLGGSDLAQAIDDMLNIELDKLGPFDLDDVYELIEWADSLTVDQTISAGEANRLHLGDRFMGNGHKTVSLLEASEGALYVLFLLALVGHEDSPKFFAVDNFDQALHPRLARALTKAISDQILADGSRQMLATTHNPLVLDGLDLLDDRVRLFTVDRDSMGASQVKRVMVSEELMAEANNGLSLSRLWLMGRLGGIPKYL